MIQTTNEVDEYNFLRLFISALTIIKGEKQIIYDNLGNDLSVYFGEEYNILFKRMLCVNNRVNLNSGFKKACSEGLINQIDLGTYEIELEYDKALEIVTTYNEIEIELIFKLVTKMYSKNSEKVNLKLYKNKNGI